MVGIIGLGIGVGYIALTPIDMGIIIQINDQLAIADWFRYIDGQIMGTILTPEGEIDY